MFSLAACSTKVIEVRDVLGAVSNSPILIFPEMFENIIIPRVRVSFHKFVSSFVFYVKIFLLWNRISTHLPNTKCEAVNGSS